MIGFFLLLQGAFYPVSFLSLLSAPQQSAVFTHFLCCTSAVTRGEHIHLKLDRTVQHCLSLLLTRVWHLRLRGDLEFLCCFSSFSRKCIIFRSSQEKTRDFLILISFELEKKMQDSNWKGTHVHLNRLEGKAGDISRVIFCF